MDQTNIIPHRTRYHSAGGHSGYYIPPLAVAGASDTGMWGDSPCPTDKVKRELVKLRKEALLPAGIRTRLRYSPSSNCFMQKRWLTVVRPADFPRAAALALEWLRTNSAEYLHPAALKEIGYTS